jgi:hypothetical protein
MFVNRNYVYWAKVKQQLTLFRRYSQLVANRCCRLACSLLETPFVTGYTVRYWRHRSLLDTPFVTGDTVRYWRHRSLLDTPFVTGYTVRYWRHRSLLETPFVTGDTVHYWIHHSLLDTPSILLLAFSLFVTRDFFFSENFFVNRFVRDKRCSWNYVPLCMTHLLMPPY